MKHNDKKYVILLGDGMADYPIKELNYKTPLEYADTANMDNLASHGLFGQVQTVPEGMSPGSDVANLAIFGYDPRLCFSGRAPLEALNMGIKLGPNDVAFRCNIVTIEQEIMQNFTANHIESELSKIIITEINKSLNDRNIEFHTGVSYRNIMVWRNYPYGLVPETTPPHDIQDQNVAQHLPRNAGSETLIKLMEQAHSIINQSQTINESLYKFKGKPRSIWLWGGGKKPQIETLQKRYGLYGYTISAVDLIHGIGKAAGLTPLRVPGATGYIDTNYTGKANALIEGLQEANFIYLHVESPDESGHEGNIEHKLHAIEDFDKKVVGPVIEGLKRYKDYSIMLLPDHATPIALKTHSSDPVPFCIYDNNNTFKHEQHYSFNEADARKSPVFVKEGYKLIEIMLQGKL